MGVAASASLLHFMAEGNVQFSLFFHRSCTIMVWKMVDNCSI